MHVYADRVLGIRAIILALVVFTMMALLLPMIVLPAEPSCTSELVRTLCNKLRLSISQLLTYITKSPCVGPLRCTRCRNRGICASRACGDGACPLQHYEPARGLHDSEKSGKVVTGRTARADWGRGTR